MICQAILKNLNKLLNTCFVLRSSSILHLAFRSAILSTLFLRWCYAILDNFHSCFMIHKLARMRYLNPSICLLELSWYRFHLKPSIRNVANCGAYQRSKFPPILTVKEVFHLFGALTQINAFR